MTYIIRSLKILLIASSALAICGAASAQSISPAAQLQQAIIFRQNLVSSILNNSLSASAAVTQLRSTAAGGTNLASRLSELGTGALLSAGSALSATGLSFASSDIDFEVAAIDVGHSLIAARRIPEATTLFQAAETTLNMLISETPDSVIHEKAQYLASRALIRSRYLGELSSAKADINAAVALEPGNRAIAALRNILSSEHSTLYATSNGN